MTQLYTVSAIVDGNGLVLNEIFTNRQEALDFESRIDEILRKTYSDSMADHPSLITSFGVRKLHKGQLNDNNLYNGGWCEDRVD